MPSESYAPKPPAWLEPELESILDAFDSAWSTGIAPNLKAFLQRSQGFSAFQKIRLLVELVKVDLEYRWRFWVLPVRSSKSDPTVKKPRLIEDYQAEFSVLPLTAELVAEEWLVRTRFGDRPSREDYHRRFPALRMELDAHFERLAPAVKGMLKSADQSADTIRETTPPPPPLPEAPAPEATAWMGRYQVARQLGKGSFGQVFLAKDPRLDRQVVVKIPHGRGGTSPEARQDLLREARLAATLRHPGLVTIYDVIFQENRCAIIMEYVPGGTLAEHLAAGKTSRQTVLEWVASIAEAVHAAHAAGLVHRDIKPANILLDERQQPKVADFGLALTERQLKREAWKVTGTPAYMAPEQVRGENHHLDGRADIWSLGVLLYEALTQRRPFEGDSLEALFSQIEFREPKRPSELVADLDPELEQVCLRCLQKVMTARYASARDLADDLRRYLAGARVRESYQPGSDLARLPLVGVPPALPLPADAFLGREQEMARLNQWLQGQKRGLLSLLGPGGIGKSRLALQFAQEIAPQFPGGAWLVDVSAATTANDIAQAVLLALGIPEIRDHSPAELVAQALQHRPPLVLLLDGIDRAVAASATIDKWIRHQPKSVFIVTTRRRLGLPGEFCLELEPLLVPSTRANAAEIESNACVKLLLAKARDAGAALECNAQTAPALAEVCRQLEGIPLAIELAAARLRVLSLAQLQSRLTRQFEVLRSTRSDLPLRQQTLQGAIAWSYDLLSPEEQDALLRLSLLPGGCTLDLAEGLLEVESLTRGDGGKGLDLIQALRDRCFLRAVESTVGVRFEMFRAIREFCLQRRSERFTPVETRADWRRITWRLLKPAGSWRDRLHSAERRLALDWFGSERDNLLACQDFAFLDGDYVTARQIGLLLDEFFAARGPGSERLARLQKLIAAPGQPNPRLHLCLSQALQAAGQWQAALDALTPDLTAGSPLSRLHAEWLSQRATLLRILGNSDEAVAELDRVRQVIENQFRNQSSSQQPLLPDSTMLLAATERELGLLLQQRGEWGEALGHFDRAEQLARQIGDEPALALALRYRSHILARQGKPSVAQPLLKEALTLAERHDDRRLLHLVLSSLGMVQAEQGAYASALAAYEQAERIARELGEPRAIATNLGNRGLALADQGLYAEAITCLEQAANLNRAIGSLSGLAVNTTNLGAALLETGQLDAAEKTLDDADRLCRARRLHVQQAFVMAELARLRTRQHNYTAAIDCWNQCRTHLQEQGREETLDGFLTFVDNGQTLRAMGRGVEAREAFDCARALAAQLSIRPDHPRLRVREALASLP